MKCKLCNEVKELQNSHIFPEFLYKPLYDEKHRFHMLAAQGAFDTVEQKGLREKLLCLQCERRMNKYETYVSRVFNGTEPIKVETHGRLTYLSELKYDLFKLFGMSILWRAGVSQLPFFSKVSLGPHEEKLRLMLHSNDPGRSDQYGALISPILQNEIGTSGIIIQPTPARSQGLRCYRFIFGGLVWGFFVSSHSAKGTVPSCFINEQNKMIMISTDINDMDFLINAMSDINQNSLETANPDSNRKKT